MLEVGTYRFVIERAQFANLERALSVVVPAAWWLGGHARVFWLRGSIFAATPYASIGLANSDLELEESRECFVISRAVARRILFELRSDRVRHLERIKLVFADNDAVFTFEYDSESKLDLRRLFSRYVGLWRPRFTPREYCEFFAQGRSYSYFDLSTERMRERLREHEDRGDESEERSDFVTIEGLSEDISHVTVSRSSLVAFLEASKNEGATFRFGFCNERYPIVCRAGDVIAILTTIE